jgi:glycosyltransferase involved in cell wall biosynthesis
VTYISPKTKEELIEIYRDNDIFVMPSITETFGLVYPEAMSQGLPVIYTKGQGFDGQLEDGEVGYSVNCFDAIQIAEKIEQIINNYNIISRNAIQHSSKFRWSLISHQYEEIYSDCLNN